MAPLAAPRAEAPLLRRRRRRGHRAAGALVPAWPELLLAGQVADYVWDNYLKSRPHANATYHKLPGANHYLQYDHAADVAAIVLKELLL